MHMVVGHSGGATTVGRGGVVKKARDIETVYVMHKVACAGPLPLQLLTSRTSRQTYGESV